MKHNKHCLDCNVELTKDNWYLSRRVRGEKICIDCFSLFNKARMTIKNKRMSIGNTNHPFHAVYRTQGKLAAYKAMGIINHNNKLEFIKKETLALYDQIKEGEVYIITNPAWKGWIKIGMAVDSEDRCKGYQTSSPLRDFKLKFKKYFTNRRTAEQKAHTLCSQKAEKRKGEWFKLDMKVAKDIINNIEVV